MFGLDELKAVLPPPAKPRITLTDKDWIALFQCIGTRLPGDFVQTYKAYGDGYFYSKSHRRSANVTLYAGALAAPFLGLVPKRLTELRVLKEKRPKCVPFPLYWEPGGLLPWGRATNGTDFCWQVRGELVDDWQVVLLRAARGEHETFEMSAIQFLARAIAGTVSPRLLPTGFPGAEGVGFEVWLEKAWLESQNSREPLTAEPGAAPSVGPAEGYGSSGVRGGPPSVS
jgi:hypothetical protein